MKLKFKIIILIVVLLVQANSCSEENGGNQDQPLITIDDFGPELKSSLPLIKTQAPAKDAFDSAEESYSSAKEPGGTFQRVLGDNDPLSIFFVVDLVDDIIALLNSASEEEVLINNGTGLSLPFFGDYVQVSKTFSYTGEYKVTNSGGSQAYSVNVEDLKGGYSDENTVITFNAKLYTQFNNSVPVINSRLVFFGQKTQNGKLAIKAARYELNDQQLSGKAQFIFNRDIEDAPFIYKAVSAAEFTSSESSRFSISISGEMEKFILRRRAHRPLESSFIDQFFVVTYDIGTKTLGETELEGNASSLPFDIDGGGFTIGGLGDSIILSIVNDMDKYLHDVKAGNMVDFSDPGNLPQSFDSVTPDWGF